VTGNSNTTAGVSSGVNVSGSSNAAYGDRAGRNVTGSYNIAVGFNAGSSFSASNTIAIGTSAMARQAGALALGSGAHAGLNAGQTNATAVGASTTANADGSSAFGVLSSATGPSSLALGNHANASMPQAVAIGANSIANVANTVSVGRAGAERRVVNLANAVNPTDAVNLRQVQALIAAAPRFPAVAATTSAKPGNASMRSEGGAGRAGSPVQPVTAAPANAAHDLGDANDKGHTSLAAAPAAASVSCELGGAKLTSAGGDHSTSSSSFSPIAQSGISFQQGGGTDGCVNLLFSAEALAPGATLMEVRAVIDDSVEAVPGPIYFAQGDDVLRAHAFNFLFPSVPPGPHRVEVHFRSTGKPGTVRVGMRTTMVQFVR
jgi:hypothetical protein